MKMSGNGARLGVFFLMVLLLGTLFVFIPNDNDVDAVGGAVVSIDLHQKQQSVQVAPGQHGTLLFTGEVKAVIPWSPRVQYLMVTLTYDATGWVASGTSTVVFTRASDTMPFSCTVKVPPMTSYSQTGNLIVSGRWDYQPGTGGGTVSPATAIITVDQYYQMSVGCDKPFVQVNPGDSLGFRLRLMNNGNSVDRMKVDVVNLDKLNNRGWQVTLSQNEFQVAEASETITTVTVTTPVKTIVWMNKVEMVQIKVVSTLAEANNQVSIPAEYFLYVRQKGFQVPGFEPMVAIFSLLLLAVAVAGFARKRLA